MIRKQFVRGWRALFAICAVLIVNAAGQESSPSPASGLTLLDAVRQTLQHHPLIGVQLAQVTINRGAKLQASALFDSLLQSGVAHNHLNTPLSGFDATQLGIQHGSDQISDLTSYTLSFGKLFRNGVSLASAYAMNRIADNSVNPVLNKSQLSFVVTVPLLRGRGRSTVAATENAAAAEIEASVLDLNQLIAQLMANTVSSYWNLVASEKVLAIATDAQQRGAAYVETVQALIEADHVPRSDLNQVAANLADRSANRIGAEQQVVAARQQLALDTGGSSHQMFTWVDPVDDFPNAEDQQLPPDTPRAFQYYMDEALRHRADFLAAKRRIHKAHILSVAATKALLPQVNLNFGSGYSGLDEGRALGHFFSSTASGIMGADATVGVSYSFPPANSSARGQMMQASASERQNELEADQVERSVSSSVVTALEGVRNAILRVRKARESVEYSRLSLDGERERYRVGRGSVVDVLTVEDRLTNALTNQVQAQLLYALALIQFRLATGTIIEPDRPVQTVEPQTFITLPFNAGAEVER
jgi:outer membrane protein